MDGLCAPPTDYAAITMQSRDHGGDPAAPPQPAQVTNAAASPSDSRALRNALGRFATGVTVVTCAGADGPVGMTVNSFASLSLDPPLVMWSPAKSSHRRVAYVAAPRFAIHVLSSAQQELASAFVTRADAFENATWATEPDGLPLMEGCLARFVCERIAEHDAGDHTILVGRVMEMAAGEGAPLLYYRGAYAKVA